jgi:hypothetical protein
MAGIKTLWTQAFPQKLKDYYDAAIDALTFKKSNTATGTDTVTINKTTGVAYFTSTCDTAPLYKDYIINNSLVTNVSLIDVNVQSETNLSFASKVNVCCVSGAIIVSVNDGFSAAAGNPIISFRILG